MTGILIYVCLSLTHAAPEGIGDLFAESQYQNNYDQPLDVLCAKGAGMYQVQSVYNGGARDRRWSWHCKNLKLNANTQCALLIMLTVLTSPCTLCVAVINTLLEFIATMIMDVKIVGGDSPAALQKDSKFMAAG